MKPTINRYLLTFCISLGATLPSQAVNISGVDVPDSLTVGEKTLLLNGAGVREKMLMDLYVGSLYLPQKATDGEIIATDDNPMAIRLDITSKIITSERMTKATLEGFMNSTGGNIDPVKTEVDEFIAQLAKPINPEDVFEFVYEPNIGTRVIKNGEALTVLKGLPFKKALFGIWLSQKPIQISLKEKMLGQ